MVEAWLLGVALLAYAVQGDFSARTHAPPAIVPVDSKLREICVEWQRRLGLTRAIATPNANGWKRPPSSDGSAVVLTLTRPLTGLSEAQLRAVIAHELAHIKRLDLLSMHSRFRGDPPLLPPRSVVAEQAHSARTAKLLRRYRDCTLCNAVEYARALT